MRTVALIGPDGAGKSTISQRLKNETALPIKYIYMGINPDASNYMLPTTRFIYRTKRALSAQNYQGGPPDPAAARKRSKSRVKNMLRDLKSILLMTNLMADEWYRQAVAWYYARRKHIIVFDRHFFIDYYNYDIRPGDEKRPWIRRVHGFMLERLYPRPELVICLDAPADVLFARKREGTVELLEARRQEYLGMRHLFAQFVTIDATQPIDDVYASVMNTLQDYVARTR